MAQSADSVDHRRVIARSIRRLKKNMIPDRIIDCSTGFELFNFTDRRDIKVYLISCHT